MPYSIKRCTQATPNIQWDEIYDPTDFVGINTGTTSWNSPINGGITVGRGTVQASYMQAGKLVVAQFRFTFGSGSAITGDISLLLPVTSAVSANLAVGSVSILDSGTTVFTGIARLSSTTVCVLRGINAASASVAGETVLSSTVPMTWATNDVIGTMITYFAA
jgi:hypothetical protein